MSDNRPLFKGVGGRTKVGERPATCGLKGNHNAKSFPASSTPSAHFTLPQPAMLSRTTSQMCNRHNCNNTFNAFIQGKQFQRLREMWSKECSKTHKNFPFYYIFGSIISIKVFHVFLMSFRSMLLFIVI